MADTIAYLRRSPLRRRLDAAGAAWRDLGDAAVAESVGAAATPAASLSPICRRCRASASRDGEQLLPHRAAVSLLNRRQIAPSASRTAVYVSFWRRARLSCCPILPATVKGLHNSKPGWRIEDEERTYPVPRRDSHAWLAVAGEASPEMFAKLCAIDLRPGKFADLAIAQTSIAKMSAILVRADIGANPVFHLLVDSAAAVYFCDCLLDAADEFGGRIVGLEALQKLEGG